MRAASKALNLHNATENLCLNAAWKCNKSLLLLVRQLKGAQPLSTTFALTVKESAAAPSVIEISFSARGRRWRAA